MTAIAVTQAQLIERYQGPRWLVSPTGDKSDADGLAAIARAGFIVIESGVKEWGTYNVIIRVRDGSDYLARIDF